MAKHWEFLEGKNVFIYPSANSDDNGAVNSEKNLAEISDKFAFHSFVVRKEEDKKKGINPLEVKVCNLDSVGPIVEIANGEAVIEGYYININSDKLLSDNKTKGVSFKLNQDKKYFIEESRFNEFIETYKTNFKILYNHTESSGVINPEIENGKWKPKKVSKTDKKTYELPYLHVIIKLLKNMTGNVRGDLTERSPDDYSKVLRLCKGMTISVCTESELKDLDTPYLDLAWILVDPNSTYDNITIYQVVNDPSRYTYVDESQVVTEDGMTIREWVKQFVNDVRDHIYKLTYCVHIDADHDGFGDLDQTGRKLAEMTLDDEDLFVERFYNDGSNEYDDKGDLVTKPINKDNHPNDYFKYTYSIDKINARTHVASKSGTTEDNNEDSRIAKIVDSRDNGRGLHKCHKTGSLNSTDNYNGTSELLARADHNHDTRYIHNSNASGTSDNVFQSVSSPFKVENDFKAGVHRSIDPETKGVLTQVLFEILGNGVDYNKSSVANLRALLNLYSGLNIENGDLVLKGEHGCKIRLIVNSSEDKEFCVDAEGTISTPGSIEAKGTIRGDKVYNAVWNDYAELFKKDVEGQEIEPGTVICKVKGKDTYAPSTLDNRELVVGVCSDTYGHLLGGEKGLTEEENLKKYIPVALSGRVYVKVVKGVPIEEGNLLEVSGEKGLASKVIGSHIPSTVIGKALESTDGTKDKILMLVSIM